MKCVALWVAMLALALATPASAGGINLAWEQCWPEGGAFLKSFACDRDSGSRALVGSFVLDEAMSDFAGLTATIVGRTPATEVPAWWQLFNTGACRQSALSISFDFADAPATSCVDPWQGSVIGGISAYQTALFPPPYPMNVPLPNALRITLAGGYPEGTSLALQAGVEYYAFRLRISNAKTIGPAACAGCLTAMCLWLYEVTAWPAAGGPSAIHLYDVQANSLVVWQTGTWGDCLVATRNRTWGSIKALYR